jgi:hypothetical protein
MHVEIRVGSLLGKTDERAQHVGRNTVVSDGQMNRTHPELTNQIDRRRRTVHAQDDIDTQGTQFSIAMGIRG